MAGIVSYGAYVPPTRLAFATIGGGAAKEGGPEKAVAWNDEDAVTMAVTAAVNCLRGFDREQVDGVMFACTTYPFEEKQGAALLARALDLPRAESPTEFGPDSSPSHFSQTFMLFSRKINQESQSVSKTEDLSVGIPS